MSDAVAPNKSLAAEVEQLRRRVAELEQKEIALRESEKRRRILLANLPQKVFFKDRDLNFLAVNEAFAAEVDCRPEDLIGKCDYDLYPADLADKYRSDDHKVMDSRDPVTLVENHVVGSALHVVEVTKAPIIDDDGQVVGLMGLFTDVTDRMRAEEALLRERYLLHAIMDNVPDYIYFKDRDSRFVRVNLALARRFGLRAPVDAVGKSDRDFFTAEHALQALADEQDVLRTSQPLVGKEEKETWFDGHETWVSTTKMPLLNNDGQVVGTFGISRDITKRRLAEEALRESEARKSAILESALDCIISMDHEGKITEFNPAAETFGYRKSEAIGKDLAELLFSATDDNDDRQRVARQVASSTGSLLGRRIECTAQRKDGSKFPAELGMTMIRLADKPAFTVYLRDITERRQAEDALQHQAQLLQEQAEELERRNAELNKAYSELKDAEAQLIHSEKMAAIGQLVAGLAHEINNPVAFVITNLAVIARDLDDILAYVRACMGLEAASKRFAPELAAELTKLRQERGIEEAADELQTSVGSARTGMNRIRDLVANLRSYSHIDVRSEVIMGDLNEGIAVTLEILKPIVRGDVRVETQLDELPLIECNLGQINQVFMNLLVNAVQAVGQKGTIKVATERYENAVCISVADDGPGIPAAIRTKIFDPFFTTKEVGKGTGLGLSISRRIVDTHRGRIELESEEGKGTTFRVWLPIKQPQ